eukprot:CAMPEP_0118800912 /NCGR_PEP_ID=MMETSP1161-20130426/2653_1 /TAXON_ID=249345 /ORGANISM="Picochlorum oklahomensis, Strain CCMP2329" /LENGTH=163 /DNA_ID=CAMNT_0006728791 /DNA_START=104 /DNA_END=595 /DNA_ORIENTATION=-
MSTNSARWSRVASRVNTTPQRAVRVYASKQEALDGKTVMSKVGAALASVALFASPVTYMAGDAHAYSGPQESIDIVCDASNVSDVINELENAEIPLLQTDVSKIKTDENRQGVEEQLQTIERETATLAEDYEKNTSDMDSLSMKANGILNQVSALKNIMRSEE